VSHVNSFSLLCLVDVAMFLMYSPKTLQTEFPNYTCILLI